MMNFIGSLPKNSVFKCVFALFAFISVLTIIPFFSWLRYPYFERSMDFGAVLMISLAVTKGKKKDLNIEKFSLLFIVYLIIASISSISYFGLNYWAVEFRVYLFWAWILFLGSRGYRISHEAVQSILYIYAMALLFVYIFNIIFATFYRPGVFGESNYDIAIISVIILSVDLKLIKTKSILIFFFFILISMSRTAMIVFSATMVSAIKSLKSLLVVMIVVFGIALVYSIRMSSTEFDSTDIQSVVDSVDRVQMIYAFQEAASENSNLIWIGQSLTGNKTTINAMEFYRDSQIVSNNLGYNTPSNFHGHILRGIYLLGVAYIFFLILIFLKLKKNYSGNARLLLTILVLVTGFTQSIFSHPFVGTFFLASIWLGFDDGQ